MPIAGPTNDHQEIRRWATQHAASPVEVLPLIVDSEPALLRMMIGEQVKEFPNVLVISWEEFFCRFDALELTFVYETGAFGYNEILQIEEKSPYRHPAYRASSFAN